MSIRVLRRTPLVALLFTALLAGCGGTGLVGPLPQGPGGARTFVLSPEAVAAGAQAPPADDAAELQTLLDLQASRTPAEVETANAWNAGACARWNEIARDLVVRRSVNPPMASRLYALLSVAQCDALLAAAREKQTFRRPAPQAGGLQPLFAGDSVSSYPCEHAAIAEASRAVLAALYPDEAAALAALAEEHQRSRQVAGVARPSDQAEGQRIGSVVAEAVLERAANDGADRAGDPVAVPTGRPEYWPQTGAPPLLPGWASVQPWMMTSGDQFRSEPPPAFGSSEWLQALEEVRYYSDNRTQEQLQIALFWADGPGTATPPGHWNQIACDMLVQRGWTETDSAELLALLNCAMMDAGICIWDTKYAYWLIRPSQADPAITTPPGLPNFPSYTSGHSGFSGAAATVLGHFFPDQVGELTRMADEAAISRLYGGIHYRFDCEVGLVQGRQVGQAALAWLNGG